MAPKLPQQRQPVPAPQRRPHVHANGAAALADPIGTSRHFRNVPGDNRMDTHFIPQPAQGRFITLRERIVDGVNVMRQYQRLRLQLDEGHGMRQEFRLQRGEGDETAHAPARLECFIQSQRRIRRSRAWPRFASCHDGLFTQRDKTILRQRQPAEQQRRVKQIAQ